MIDWDAIKHALREIGECVLACLFVFALLIVIALVAVPLFIVLSSEAGS